MEKDSSRFGRDAKKELEELAAKAAALGDPELGCQKDSPIYQACSTGEARGKALYKSLSDEELLEALRRRTEELGYVPAQKEVFWAYRAFIRLRFGKWPYALKAAGLSTRAGKGGMAADKIKDRNLRYEEMMGRIRAKAKELGRPPHMFEMDEERRELQSWFKTWAEVLDAAGVDRSWQTREILYKAKGLNEEEKKLLEEIKNLAMELGRPPLRSEVPGEMRQKLYRRCGTWRNTLYQLGLEPVSKISPFSNTYLSQSREKQRKHQDVLENSLYKLVEPDQRTRNMLDFVRKRVQELGRAPLKSELPPHIYTALLKKCGTYRNLLYQLGLEPLEKSAAAQIQAELRNKKKEDK